MKIPAWFKPGVYGALAGAVVFGAVGFSWGGWVTGGSANEAALALAQEKVTAALVPICLDIAKADPDRIAQLATIRDASSFKRRDAVMAAGWATVPGSDVPDRNLAQACAAALDLDGS